MLTAVTDLDMFSVSYVVVISCITSVILAAEPRECRRSTVGCDYLGRLSTTPSGRTCQAWSSQTPHSHTYTDPLSFPDNTLEDATNYCRNPDADPGGLWCYTTDPDVRWEYCDVPACSAFPDCKLTDSGTEYRGDVSVTVTGLDCVTWQDGEDVGTNHCRNLDNKSGGPWCYTDFVGGWEYCNITFCKPSAHCSRTLTAQEYVGTVSVTRAGVPCQRWESQYPHPHNFTSADIFPDITLDAANNYCRNPNSEDSGLWCYTQDQDTTWDYCDVPLCQDCRVSNDGAEYSGSRSVTNTGKTCQNWQALPSTADWLKDTNRFPDASLAGAENFCRNPDRKAEGPWCFTDVLATQWEYCGIDKCTGSLDDVHKPRRSNHVLHIGIDGLHPCFINCSTGAPNILERLGARGTWTLSRGRTMLQTVSAPSWTASLCSMAVESTGVTNNAWRAPWLGYGAIITPSTGKTLPLPCAWNVIKSQDVGVRTAVFMNWDWFHYITSWGMPTAIDHDYSCDAYAYGGNDGGYAFCDELAVHNATEYLTDILRAAQASYTFVYIANVDVLGHAYRWCESEYLTGVDRADQLVGLLLDVIDDAGMSDDVTVLLSTDHGGHGFNHGDWSDSDLIIPLFVRGPGVRQGVEFRHEVRNMDLVPTALEMLGLRQSPWWKGDVLDEAFDA